MNHYDFSFLGEIIENINERTFAQASNRKKIRTTWKTAIEKGNSLTTEIQYFGNNNILFIDFDLC